MPMSKDEFRTLVSTEIQVHGKFSRQNVLPVDIPAFVDTADTLNANIHYAENTTDELFTATIKPKK